MVLRGALCVSPGSRADFFCLANSTGVDYHPVELNRRGLSEIGARTDRVVPHTGWRLQSWRAQAADERDDVAPAGDPGVRADLFRASRGAPGRPGNRRAVRVHRTGGLRPP